MVAHITVVTTQVTRDDEIWDIFLINWLVGMGIAVRKTGIHRAMGAPKKDSAIGQVH